MGLSDLVVVDDLTILLGLISATLFLIRNLYRPQPSLHPILLGRQSDVARVRYPGESAIYRNYGTGLVGRLPVRPSKDVNILLDFLNLANDAPRTLWSTKVTLPKLSQRVGAFATGLVRIIGLTPESGALILLNDSIEFLISDLALATHSVPSFTVTSPTLLTAVFQSRKFKTIITSAEFLPSLKLSYESGNRGLQTIVIVGDDEAEAVARGALPGVDVFNFADVEARGAKMETAVSPSPSPKDVFTVSFFETESGRVQEAHLSHQNVTAGVVAIRALVPTANALSSLDTIASSHSLSTAFGRILAYSALFEGANFATLDSTKIFNEAEVSKDEVADVMSVKAYPIPSPTVIFIHPRHLKAISSTVVAKAQKSSYLYPLAWRHKLSKTREGFVTKESLWDRLLFDSARANVVGDGAGTIRSIVVGGGALEVECLDVARIAFSVPVVSTYVHPLVAGPVFASHPLDLQYFPAAALGQDPSSHLAHVGPPGVNVEAKLVGVDDQAVEEGADPIGVLSVRGPPVGKLSDRGGDNEGVDEQGQWVEIGIKAKVLRNGTFKILT